MKPSVSLAMIARDEAGRIGRCLGSVADLVDEVVVVDTGSADSTREVAAGFGARVVDFPWGDSFSDARNESLRRARGAWALWLDADEWLEDGSRARLRALIAGLGDGEAVYLMDQVSDLGGAGRDSLSVAQPRLFRNSEGVRWRYRVHEQILEAWRARGAPILAVDVAIRHSGYESADLAGRKQGRNVRLLEMDLADRPGDPWVLFQLGRARLDDRFPDAERLLLRALGSPEATGLMRRQIHGLLARGYRARGEFDRARRTLAEGLQSHPGDALLLHEWGGLALEAGDPEAAEEAARRLLAGRPDGEECLLGSYPSLRGWRARDLLAAACFRRGRVDEAESHWWAAASEAPDAGSAWRGLGELYLAQSRWGEFELAARRLGESDPGGASLLRARGYLARREFAAAREVLAGAIARAPSAIAPRLLLGYSHLAEGADPGAAARAYREVLAIDPRHAEARAGLRAARRGRGVGPEVAGVPGR